VARQQIAGTQPGSRAITPRIPARLLPQSGSRRPPPARKPGVTLPGILPGGKKSTK
jgi:hypothetical protein